MMTKMTTWDDLETLPGCLGCWLPYHPNKCCECQVTDLCDLMSEEER